VCVCVCMCSAHQLHYHMAHDRMPRPDQQQFSSSSSSMPATAAPQQLPYSAVILDDLIRRGVLINTVYAKDQFYSSCENDIRRLNMCVLRVWSRPEHRRHNQTGVRTEMIRHGRLSLQRAAWLLRPIYISFFLIHES